MSEAWHRGHPLPRTATGAERVAWHAEHARVCGCRDVPESLRAQVAKLARRQVVEGAAEEGGPTLAGR